MSRRMTREGHLSSHTQYVQNMRFWADPRCKEDARGWLQPFAVWQGWDEYNHAVYALWCVILWSQINRNLAAGRPTPLIRKDGTLDRAELWRGMDIARIESDLRSFHFHLAQSRKCDRPRLP